MVGMVSGVVFGMGVGFGSLQDGGARFSFVGCFKGRFTKSDVDGGVLPLWIVFLEDFLRVRMRVILPAKSLCGMGLSTQNFWNWVDRVAIISSRCLVNRSSIDPNVLNMRSSCCSVMSQRGCDTKMLRTSVTRDEQ